MKKLINEPIDVIESFLKGTDDVLAGAVYSKDAERAKKVALAIETGQIFINQPSSAHPELPFGGIKNSGFGREMSDIGLFEFANEKIVVD